MHTNHNYRATMRWWPKRPGRGIDRTGNYASDPYSSINTALIWLMTYIRIDISVDDGYCFGVFVCVCAVVEPRGARTSAGAFSVVRKHVWEHWLYMVCATSVLVSENKLHVCRSWRGCGRSSQKCRRYIERVRINPERMVFWVSFGIIWRHSEAKMCLKIHWSPNDTFEKCLTYLLDSKINFECTHVMFKIMFFLIND